MTARHPPHILVNKALTFDKLETLFTNSRVDHGFGPVELSNFGELLLEVFAMGHRSKDPVQHHFRSTPSISNIWPTIVAVFDTPPSLYQCDNETEATLKDKDVLDSLEQRYYKKWLSTLLRYRELKNTIRSLADRQEEVAKSYHPFSFFTVERDFEHLLSILENFEELPLRRPEKMRWHESWDIVVAKNNVLAMCTPPEGMALEGIGPGLDEQDGAGEATAGVESGYFALLVQESLSVEELSQAANATGDALAVPAAGPGGKKFRLVWTPNIHFQSVGLSPSHDEENESDRSESPLPPGWDMAYDPITGANYYIDHTNMKTTWIKPECESSAPPGERSAPGWCCCGKSVGASLDNTKGHRCSIAVSLFPSAAAKIYAKWDEQKDDAGYFLVLSTNEAGERVDLIILLRGFGAMVDGIKGVEGCILHCVNNKAEGGDLPNMDFGLAEVSGDHPKPDAKVRVPGLQEDAESEFVTLETWKSFLDESGRHTDWDAFRKLVFFRGLDRDARSSVWPLLLDVFPAQSTYKDRERIKKELEKNYIKQKNSWLMTPVGESSKIRERIRDIYKDTLRTDREQKYYAGELNPNVLILTDMLITTCLENPDVAYVQGMSDILAPILMVLDHEAVAHMCFKSNLKRLLPYFDGGPGMSKLLEDIRALTEHFFPHFYTKLCEQDMLNMFFCYRWMLLDFKREFDLNDVMRVWETIWCRHRSDKFHLFIALAIMKVHNPYPSDPDVVPEREPNLLEYYANIAGQLNTNSILTTARSILYEIRLEKLPERLEQIEITTDISGTASSTIVLSEHTENEKSTDTENNFTIQSVLSRADESDEVDECGSSAKMAMNNDGTVEIKDELDPTIIKANQECVAQYSELDQPQRGDDADTPATNDSTQAENNDEASPVTVGGDISAAAESSSSTKDSIYQAVFTPELLAVAPPNIIEACRSAVLLDAGGSTDDALHGYLTAIDDVLAIVKTLPKADPASRAMKKLVKYMLVRADHLKYLM